MLLILIHYYWIPFSFLSFHIHNSISRLRNVAPIILNMFLFDQSPSMKPIFHHRCEPFPHMDALLTLLWIDHSDIVNLKPQSAEVQIMITNSLGKPFVFHFQGSCHDRKAFLSSCCPRRGEFCLIYVFTEGIELPRFLIYMLEGGLERGAHSF